MTLLSLGPSGIHLYIMLPLKHLSQTKFRYHLLIHYIFALGSVPLEMFWQFQFNCTIGKQLCVSVCVYIYI